MNRCHFILFYIVTIVSLSTLNCVSYWDRITTHATPDKNGTIIWSFRLQPYKGTILYINNKRINYEITKTDNSLALIQVRLNKADFRNESIITCKNNRYQKKTITSETIVKSIELNTIPLHVLDKKGSKHRYYSSWNTGSQPKSVRFLDHRRVLVPLLADHGIDIIDLHTGKTDRLTLPQRWAKHKAFVESMVDHSAHKIWISQMNTGTVHIFSLDTLEYIRSVKTSGNWLKVILDDCINDRAFCANWLSKSISVINKNTYTESHTFHAYGVPRGMILSKDRKYLYVCQYGMKDEYDRKGRIAKIDSATGKLVRLIGQPGVKRHIVNNPGHKRYYVSDMLTASVYAFDEKSDTLVKKIPVFSHPNTIALSPDSSRLYVSCRGRNNPESYLLKGLHMGRIYVIDTETLSISEFWEGGNQCTGLAVSPDGEYVVFSDFLDNRIRVYTVN